MSTTTERQRVIDALKKGIAGEVHATNVPALLQLALDYVEKDDEEKNQTFCMLLARPDLLGALYTFMPEGRKVSLRNTREVMMAFNSYALYKMGRLDPAARKVFDDLVAINTQVAGYISPADMRALVARGSADIWLNPMSENAYPLFLGVKP